MSKRRLSVPNIDTPYKPPLLGGIWAFFSMPLWFIGGWELVLWAAPFVLYLTGGAVMNRHEFTIDDKWLRWVERPLPFRRGRRYKIAELEWVGYGEMVRRQRHDAVRFSVVIRRQNGKVTRVLEHLESMAKAEQIARQLGEACGVAVVSKLS
jgi:hypothetical protein